MNEPLTELVKSIETEETDVRENKRNVQEQILAGKLEQERKWLAKRRKSLYEKRRRKHEYLKDLRTWFDSLDTDKSGEISLSEMVWPMLAMGQANNREEVETIFKKIDTDGSGQIGFQEFVDLMTTKSKCDHPLEKMYNQMKNKENSSLSLELAIPKHHRKVILQGLEMYGNTTRQPQTVAEIQSRQVYEQILDRAEKALRLRETDLGITIENTNKETLKSCNINRKCLKKSKALRIRQNIRERLNWNIKSPDLNNIQNEIIDSELANKSRESGKDNEEFNVSKGNDDMFSKEGEIRKLRRKKVKIPRVVTYTLSPGELIPHPTVVKLPHFKSKKQKYILPKPKGSQLGLVPVEKQMELDRRFNKLGVTRESLVKAKNISDGEKRQYGIGGGRWGFS